MPFEFDSLVLPRFFTVVGTDNGHFPYTPVGAVLAETSVHSTKGWVTVGYVSKTTPFGQGTYLGYEETELREATAEEVLEALEKDHPHDPNFRPHDLKSSDLGFQLILSRAFGNWTTDSGKPSVIPFSRNDIRQAIEKTASDHQSIMDRWTEITDNQKEIIREHFAVS